LTQFLDIEPTTADGADTVGGRLENLLTRLRIAQGRETELIFEARHVDVDVGN
jgi:hypothetical protein